MPTKHRRHAITETPDVQAALDELRGELGRSRVELGELVILGANQKLAELRAQRDGTAARRRALADRVRQRDLPVDVEAADAVRRSGWAGLERRATARQLRLGATRARLPPQRAGEVADALEAGRIAICLPFLLEAGSSARDAVDHRGCSTR